MIKRIAPKCEIKVVPKVWDVTWLSFLAVLATFKYEAQSSELIQLSC